MNARNLHSFDELSGNPHSPRANIHDTQDAPSLLPVQLPAIAPPINRASMAPRAWPPARCGPLISVFKRHTRQQSDAPTPQGNWSHAANLRRMMLLLLTLVQTIGATWLLLGAMPYHGGQPMEIVSAALFAILFCWISGGFWTAVMGFLVLLTGRDRYSISATTTADAPIDPQARTAIVMPICNEHVARVFAGLRATFESVREAGMLPLFDFYVLSDSNDPDTRVAEMAAWNKLCRDTDGYGRIFYRWRKQRIKRKSGNLADFCRRWGKNYPYMVVMDADSVMTGGCLASLVRLMEANPNAGIIQSIPSAAGRDTLYSRVQQFAARAYGPLFSAGLHFWQLGESHYWGHNAIIRIAPFMRHCALGRLPGKGALSGEILSHDFVEAALMRRAGWGVWLAYDLPGSYEEVPPNLIDELKRDRRWCHGNLMNSRLALAQGMHVAHRAVFMSGVFAYVSAPLWFLLLVLSTVQLAVDRFSIPVYFVEPHQLFPIWPAWDLKWAIVLLGVTGTLLYLPKLLSIVLILEREAEQFGGRMKVVASMLGEMLFSMLLAPIRMLFHSQFVAAGLFGISVQWKSPPREDAETGWGEAARRHGVHTLLGVAWAGLVYWINPSFLVWLLPVIGALILSMPLSVLSSRARIGRSLRARNWFVIPEESHPPVELSRTKQWTEEADAAPGFSEAINDPAVNSLVRSCAGARAGFNPAPARAKRRESLLALVQKGLSALDVRQKMALLDDHLALAFLHAGRTA